MDNGVVVRFGNNTISTRTGRIEVSWGLDSGRVSSGAGAEHVLQLVHWANGIRSCARTFQLSMIADISKAQG